MEKKSNKESIFAIYLSMNEDTLFSYNAFQYSDTSNCDYQWYDHPAGKNLYIINTASELRGFEDLVNIGETTFAGTTVKLGSDIDLQGVTKNGDGITRNMWHPIGTENFLFEGTFDGAGHRIKGMYIKESFQYSQGFFRSIGSGAKIINLNIVDSIVSGTQYVGGLIGMVPSTSNSLYVRNCSFEGVLNSIEKHSCMGGLIGDAYKVTLLNCRVRGQIKSYIESYSNSTQGMTGGIVGYARGCIIDSCINNANIISIAYNTGGIAGNNLTGMVTRCINTGNIAGKKFTGGIVGKNMSNGKVISCANKGSVTAFSSYTGGIAGSSIGSLGFIDTCINKGKVIGTEIVGGILGLSEGSAVRNSTNYSIITGKTNIGGITGLNAGKKIEHCTDQGELFFI